MMMHLFSRYRDEWLSIAADGRGWAWANLSTCLIIEIGEGSHASA